MNTEIYRPGETILIEELKQIVRSARSKVYAAINQTMVEAYWQIGKRIVEEEQNGKERADYGTKLLKTLSAELTAEFGKGFSTNSLYYFRQFYLCFPKKLPTSWGILTWSHYKRLLSVVKPEARNWYLKENFLSITKRIKPTSMKHTLPFLIVLLLLAGCHRPTKSDEQETVTITGRVTDYEGHPIDSCSIWWKTPTFENAVEVFTDKEGHYTAHIPKGKYQSVAAIHMPSYASVAMQEGKLKEEDYRLEYWAWDFVADRDTTLDIRYHRMEAYGLRVFRIPGATPGYQIYVRPMSLTRTLNWMKLEANKRGKECQMAPRPEHLSVKVWIDGEEVAVLMKQEIKEYLSADEYCNAYLLTVGMSKQSRTDVPYHTFKLELTDLENGDRGEGVYYMDREDYVK